MSLERCSKVLWDTCVQLCVFKASCLLHLQCRVFQNEKATLGADRHHLSGISTVVFFVLMSITGRKVTHFNQLKTNCQLVSPSCRAKLPYSHSLHDKSEAEVLAAKLSKAKKPLEKIPHIRSSNIRSPTLLSGRPQKGKRTAPQLSDFKPRIQTPRVSVSSPAKRVSQCLPCVGSLSHTFDSQWVLCLTHVMNNLVWTIAVSTSSCVSLPSILPLLLSTFCIS